MRSGILYQPYALQWVGGRLKLWCALRPDNGGAIRRYEVIVDKGNQRSTRQRPFYEETTQYRSNFLEYTLPDDLSGLREVSYPRHPRDRIHDAIMDTLNREQVALVTAFTLTGLPPAR